MDFEFKPRGSSKYVEKRFPREKTLMRRKKQEILDRKQRKYRDQKHFASVVVPFFDEVIKSQEEYDMETYGEWSYEYEEMVFNSLYDDYGFVFPINDKLLICTGFSTYFIS